MSNPEQGRILDANETMVFFAGDLRGIGEEGEGDRELWFAAILHSFLSPIVPLHWHYCV